MSGSSSQQQPSTDSQETEPKPRRRLKGWHVLLIGLGSVAGLFVVWCLGVSWRLDAEIAAIREAGYPTSLAELDEWDGDAPPNAQKGATLYRQAIRKRVPVPKESQKHVPVLGKDFAWPGPWHTHPAMTEKMLAASEGYLETNAAALDLLQRAGRFEGVRLGGPIPHHPSPNWLRNAGHSGNNLHKYRLAARLLALEAIVHAEKGEAEPVIEAVEAMWVLAGAIEEMPFLVDQLSAGSIRLLAVKHVVERALNRMEFTVEELDALAAAMPAVDFKKNAKRAMVGELAVTLHQLRTLPRDDVLGQVYGLNPRDYKWANDAYTLTGLYHMDRAIFLSAARRAMKLADEPTAKRLAGLKQICGGIERLSPLYTQFSRSNTRSLPRIGRQVIGRPGHPGSGPSAPDYAIVLAQNDAAVRCGRAALAVQRYRLTEGEPPDTLAALVPRFIGAVPNDPFTGKPLKYKKLKDGFTVYSVGEDGKDNGGARTNSAGKQFAPGTDLPFAVRR